MRRAAGVPAGLAVTLTRTHAHTSARIFLSAHSAMHAAAASLGRAQCDMNSRINSAKRARLGVRPVRAPERELQRGFGLEMEPILCSCVDFVDGWMVCGGCVCFFVRVLDIHLSHGPYVKLIRRPKCTHDVRAARIFAIRSHTNGGARAFAVYLPGPKNHRRH